MGLKAVVEDVESIPEELRPLYTEREGVHVLDVDPDEEKGWALENVRGLRSALSRKTEDLRSAKSQGEEALTRATALEAELESLKAGKGKDQATLRAELEAEIGDRYRPMQERAERAEARVDALLLGNRWQNALSDATEDVRDLLIQHAIGRTRIRREGEHEKFEILDEDGSVLYGNDGDPLSFDGYAERLRAARPGAFKGKGSSGSGTSAGKTGAGASGTSAMPKHRGDFADLTTKSAWIHENGIDKFLALPTAPTA